MYDDDKVIMIHDMILTIKADIKTFLTPNFFMNHVTHKVIRLTPKKGKFPL